jgi:hypothetical protein
VAGVVQRLIADHLGGGRHRLGWNVRNGAGKVVRDGRYIIRVRAVNAIEPVALSKPVQVRRRF